MMRNTTTKFKSAQFKIGSVHACKTGYVVFSLLNRQLFQRTAEKTAVTPWSRTLVPPQQATKNGAGCAAKQIP